LCECTRVFDVFDIVKAGLAGLHNRLIWISRSNWSRLMFLRRFRKRVLMDPWPGFISGHGTPMLSDQALKQGRLEDALACAGDEGRSKLR
jgi:hypothetical protein